MPVLTRTMQYASKTDIATVLGGTVNLILNSQDFDNASWTKNDCSITPNTLTAPDSTATGDELTVTGATQNMFPASTITVTNGGTYTTSVYLQAGSGAQWVLFDASDTGGNSVRRWFDILNGVLGTFNTTGAGWTTVSSGIQVSGSWFRCWISYVVTGSVMSHNFLGVTADAITTRDTSAVIGVWGWQDETGSSPTPYVKTP